MSEFHTDNPKLYRELGLEDLLEDQPVEAPEQWGYYANRVTDSDHIVALRRVEETQQFEAIPISLEGAKEPIAGNDKATDAYFHPNVTPGLEAVTEVDRWDEALDAYNELAREDRVWAARQVESDISKGFFAPTLVLDAVKRQTRQRQSERQLEQAA